MSTSIDKTITADLQAFGAAHGHPRAGAPEPGLRGHHPVTSGESTALAVRRSAARLRVERLAPVHARRMARAVTGVAAVVAAYQLNAFISDPASVMEPGLNILAALAVLAVVYLVTRAVSARRFARRFVRVRADANEETLEARARERVERVDGWSTALAVLGISCVLPFLGAILAGEPVWSYAHGADVRAVEAVFGLSNLRTCALASVVPAMLLGSALSGLRGERPPWLRHLESTRALAIAVALAVLAFGLATSAADEVETATMSGLGQIARAALAQVAITAIAVWTALRLRRNDSASFAVSPRP
jgi:hypothetical protein